MSETISIKKVTKNQAREMITKFHYLKDKGFRYKFAYGLYENDEIIGVAVYHGPSAPETIVGAFGLQRTDQDGFWELGRMVLKKDKNGANYGSMLIGRSIKMLRKETDVRALITYAESTRHYGALYQATNFIYCGLSSPKKDFYLANGKKQERGITKGVEGEWRPRPQKHRYIMVFDKKLNLKWGILPYYKCSKNHAKAAAALKETE